MLTDQLCATVALRVASSHTHRSLQWHHNAVDVISDAGTTVEAGGYRQSFNGRVAGKIKRFAACLARGCVSSQDVSCALDSSAIVQTVVSLCLAALALSRCSTHTSLASSHGVPSLKRRPSVTLVPVIDGSSCWTSHDWPARHATDSQLLTLVDN